MRLVFAGTPQTAVPSLTALLKSRHEVVAVITRPDAAAGRGLRTGPSPVARHAAEAGLEILKPATPREPAFLDRLRALAPGCCPVTAYGALIPKAALEIPRHGWVNLHFSLLPAWRGAAPVPHAILHGDDVTGATTFQLVPELDAGPVYGVLTEPIGAHDSAGDLLERLAESGAGLLAATLDGIESGQLRPQPQPSVGVSHAPKLAAADAHVRWSVPAHIVDRQIRACTPVPGAWAMLGETRLKMWPVRIPATEPPGPGATPGAPGPRGAPGGRGAPGRPGTPGSAGAQEEPERLGAPAQPADGRGGLRPGELRVTRDCVLVGTATHPVELGDVQPSGKRRMSATDWARGLHLAATESGGALVLD